MADLKLRRHVSSAFNLSGFRIQSDACSFLANQLQVFTPEEREEWIEKITDRLQLKSLESPVVEKAALVEIIQEISDGLTETEPVFNVINSYDVPDFDYNFDRKIFLPSTRKKGLFVPCGEAKDKAHLFVNRYTYVFQRTARHSLFLAPPVNLNSDAQAKHYKLRTIESLLCTSTEQQNVVVLGMIAQLKECKFFLEDPTGSVELDLSETAYQEGIPTECSVLLAEGWYADKIFHISGLGQPPAELSLTSRVFFGNANTFGGKSEKSLKNSEKLAALEQANDDAIVFISDVWIDRQIVIEKLHVMFEGYSEHPPVAFVLMGNFLSSEVGYYEQCEVLRERFKVLGDLVAQFPAILQKSRFVLVPGSDDPTAARILPRAPLPDHIVEEFVKRVPKTELGTNPCRIQYCTQEIVVFRDNLMSKMCRNTFHYPRTGNIVSHFTSFIKATIRSRFMHESILESLLYADLYDFVFEMFCVKFVRSVVAQGHLAPFPMNVSPVYWQHDCALRLYPLPDLLVIGDRIGPFSDTHKECQVAVTSSFVKTKFSFKVYACATRTIEESQLPDN